MAKQINPNELPLTNRHARYQWDKWLTPGDAWVATRGKDFDITAASFRGSLVNAAKRRGVRVTTRVLDDNQVAWLVRKK